MTPAAGTPARTADSACSAWSTRGRRSRQSRPVASAWFSASTAATSSWSRLRTCLVRFRRWSSGARRASRSHRRMRSTSVARNGGHDRARCPASSAVSTGGSWVPVTVRVSCSSAAAWASQPDLLRDLQSSQPAASTTTRRISRLQPRAPSPSDSAAAGVPATAVVGAGGRGSVRGWRVPAGPGWSGWFRGRLIGDSVPLGAGRVPERSVVGRVAESLPPPAPQPLSPRTRLSTSPAREPGRGCPAPGCAGFHLPVPGRGHDPPREHPRRPHRRPPPDRPGQAGGARPAYDRHSSAREPSSASPEAGENGVGWAHLAMAKPRQPFPAVSRPIRSVGEVQESAGARARSIPPGSALTAAGEAVNQVRSTCVGSPQRTAPPRRCDLPARCGAHYGRGRALGGRDDHRCQPARGRDLQLRLLGFGIVGAAQVVGLPSSDALVDTPTNQLGWWAPWVGVLLVGIGTYLVVLRARRLARWPMPSWAWATVKKMISSGRPRRR